MRTARVVVFKPSAFFDAASDAEGDMRKVNDLALIVHDYMEDPHALDEERKNALSWLTLELVNLGRRLKEHSDQLYEAAKTG